MNRPPKVRPTNLTFGGVFMAKYDEEFKLAIVKAYLIGEGGYRSLAREWGLPDPKPLKKLGSHKLYLIDVVDG